MMSRHHTPPEIEAGLVQESFKGAFEAGKEPLKAAMLINGGAAVVLLNFLGSVSKEGHKALGLALTAPLLAFACGVVLAGVAFAGRYSAQVYYTLGSEVAGRRWHWVAAITAGVSFAAFMFGVWEAFLAFRAHFR